MSHEKAFLMGATGVVQGRLGWAHQTIKQLFDEYEPIITGSNWLQGQEFNCIHYVMRFGNSAADEIETLRINKFKELPVASQLSMSDLHSVFLDKARLRTYLETELRRVLTHIRAKYKLPPIQTLNI